MNQEIHSLIREGDGRGPFVVNPYSIPSKVQTVHKFFEQLKRVPRLSMFAEDVPDGRYDDKTMKRLFEYLSGPANDDKYGILEDCLLQFRKILVNDLALNIDINRIVGNENKIHLLKLHPVIVQSMYLQLFCELHEHNVKFVFSSFGIGQSPNFLFDHFYCEDHPHIFWD